MPDPFDTLRQQGTRQNVFTRLDPPMTLPEAAELAEAFDVWEAEVLILRACHPTAALALQALVRRN